MEHHRWDDLPWSDFLLNPGIFFLRKNAPWRKGLRDIKAIKIDHGITAENFLFCLVLTFEIKLKPWRKWWWKSVWPRPKTFNRIWYVVIPKQNVYIFKSKKKETKRNVRVRWGKYRTNRALKCVCVYWKQDSTYTYISCLSPCIWQLEVRKWIAHVCV